MSLKWFHLFFVGTCVLLTVVVAVWALRSGQWLMALAAVGGGSALILYRGAFQRKARELGLR